MLSERQRRLDIARRLDVDEALKITSPYIKGGPKDNGVYADRRETVLAGMHKVRVMSPGDFSAEERASSADWLRENGWGIPVIKDGVH